MTSTDELKDGLMIIGATSWGIRAKLHAGATPASK